ncbi:hypothetical protein Dsin_028164 [Dipteronia sinensis]|uniref:Uncharacterized protein n=1 Tax=Dipteronia sinensis TaxID=43782 RepID=A0AAE0DU01_9ROSI|nr:hypothetical protein Dsin_028164 [Dipteronia sinensis]
MEEVDTQPPAMMSSESRKEAIESRCRTETFSGAKLCVEQKDVVKALGFGSLLSINCGRLRRYIYSFIVDKFDNDTLSVELYGKTLNLNTNVYSQIMGLKNSGQPISLDGDSKQIKELIEIYKSTSRGIKVNVLIEIMKNLRSADDEFKITFMLFVIGTVFCPQGGIYWNTLLFDRSKIPVTAWTKKWFTKWLQQLGGLESPKGSFGIGMRQDGTVVPYCVWNLWDRTINCSVTCLVWVGHDRTICSNDQSAPIVIE